MFRQAVSWALPAPIEVNRLVVCWTVSFSVEVDLGLCSNLFFLELIAACANRGVTTYARVCRKLYM